MHFIFGENIDHPPQDKWPKKRIQCIYTVLDENRGEGPSLLSDEYPKETD
jgi:hypothetical protein